MILYRFFAILPQKFVLMSFCLIKETERSRMISARLCVLLDIRTKEQMILYRFFAILPQKFVLMSFCLIKKQSAAG
ncbi:hypothetical protein DXB57_11480 [Bacteroides fragilis]|nr:hypothetical protein HMPREF1203_00104 [Bacteroides fragilis HMW 610]RGN60639.1 hypothetical protein DXB57_11480 [Bacteroides fragilis]